MSSATLTLPSLTSTSTNTFTAARFSSTTLTSMSSPSPSSSFSSSLSLSCSSSSSTSSSATLATLPTSKLNKTQNLLTNSLLFKQQNQPQPLQHRNSHYQQQQQEHHPHHQQLQQQQQQQQQQHLLTNANTSSAGALTCLHLHAIYPKNKRKYYFNNKIYKERRKRHNVLNEDGINSYLSLILLVTFTKPLTMWYRFIKSIILTTTTSPTANTTSATSATTKATQRLFSKTAGIKTNSSSSSSHSSSSSSLNKTPTLLNTSRSSLPSCSSSSSSSTSSKCIRVLPPLGTTTSFFTLLTIICLETILLSTMSSCAKTFYMHWNTSNSIFRIDNTDHIIDVNKGNLAFEFDQVHIICPVYEPGTFDNETEKYIIYNVSKVEYETCRITNADPRVIAICDKPQKLMFFTITFRPFTPQPGGLEFLPGNDYYFISTSSKDDLYRRIGGRCSTNNMKVVFKVCCASEEKNKTTTIATGGGGSGGGGGAAGGSGSTSTTAVGNAQPTDSAGNSAEDITNQQNQPQSPQNQHPHHINQINTIGINGINTGMLPNGVMTNNNGLNGLGNNQHNGLQLNPIMNSPSGNVATSINTNIDQFNRIPMQPNSINVLSNNIGNGLNMGNLPPGMSGNNGLGLGTHGGSGILLTPGHNGINMIAGGVGSPGGIPGIHQYPGHGYHGQTGIRINNVPSTHHTNLKNMQNNNNDNDHHHYDKHPNEVVKNEELTYNRAASSMNTATALSFILLLTLATQICFWV